MKLLLPLLFALVLLAGCTSSEEQALKRARMTDTVVVWENFLRDFPDGKETAAARRRLVELHEDREWQRAQLADSVVSYQEYLQGYPQGRFSGEALVRIANLNLREIPDHEPTPEELRAVHLSQLSGKAVEVEATPEDQTVAAAASSSRAATPAPTPAPASGPPSATKGPTALIRRGPPQITRLVPAKPVAPQAAVKAKPAPIMVPKSATKPVPAPAPIMVAKPATKPVPAPASTALPVVKPAVPPAPAPVAVAGGLGWAVQLGAFGKGEAAALQHWQRLQRLVPAAVNGLGPDVATPTEGKDFHRLRVVGLSRERARDLCVAVRGAGEGCVVTAP